tara:strand:+ start:8089 stop:8262 length:174 start_codon:yes stop_codon:yes gene_type:complete
MTRLSKTQIWEHIDNRLEMVSKEEWITMIGKYLNVDDLYDLLDCNELSPRFFEGEDE